MKINAINNYILNTFQPQKTTNLTTSNNQNKQFDYSFLEALGRSQVNFTGKEELKKYQEYDKLFIETVAQNLRLSEEDKQKLTNNINTFLKTNGFKSLEDIVGDKNHELQSDFISELGDDICQSDFDFNILSDAFQDRMYYDGQYTPEVDLYEKDYEVVDHILDKYEMDETRKAEIFDVLKMHADCLGGETVFDLFKPENKPLVLMDLVKEQLQLNDDLTTDLLIDFCLMAKKDDKARHEGIYPWKMTALLNEQAKDTAIASEIIGEYDLADKKLYECDVEDDADYDDYNDDYDDDDIDNDDDDDYSYNQVKKTKSTMEEITEQLNRRRDGVSVEQISFELMEKYNLPSTAYEFIQNTIYDYDADELADD